MDAMIGLTMPLCPDDIVLSQASSARGYARVLLDMQCRSAVVVHSRAAGLHTVRRFGLASRLHYGCEQYLSKKPHGCPCGYYGDSERECTCSMTLVSRYQKRLSGPLLDRIDIHVEVPRVPFQKLS